MARKTALAALAAVALAAFGTVWAEPLYQSCSWTSTGVAADFWAGDAITVDSLSGLDENGLPFSIGPSPAFSTNAAMRDWLSAQSPAWGGWLVDVDASHFVGIVTAAFTQKTPQSLDFTVATLSGSSAFTSGFYKSSDCFDLPVYTPGASGTVSGSAASEKFLSNQFVTDVAVIEIVAVFCFTLMFLPATFFRSFYSS